MMIPPLSGTWGWPWHGLCSGGAITLPNAATKTIPQPAHGSAWLYDLGLPAITRTTAQLSADTALGYEWRNYGMVSGGVVYGKSLAADQFIHVDEAGECWLIGAVYEYIEASLQKVRFTFSIVRFGLFGEGQKTPISVVKDVQCTYISYSVGYGVTYTGYNTVLEDVWTNGTRSLFSVARTGGTLPNAVREIFSLIELTITGTGGADGSGLVLSPVEIKDSTQLSKSFSANTAFDPSVSPGGSYLITDSTYSPCEVRTYTFAGGIVFWNANAFMSNTDISKYYARYAYYNSVGGPIVARLKISMFSEWTYTGSSFGSAGADVNGTPPYCDGPWTGDGRATSSSSATAVYRYGIYLMENDTVIDSLECYQTASRTQDFFMIPGLLKSPDTIDYTGWGTTGGNLYTKNDQITGVFSPAVWQGSLASVLPLPPPPNPGAGLQAFSNDAPPLDLNALAEIWRNYTTHHEVSGESVVAGSAALGIQRIDAKAASFYAPGATRTYGTIMTPLGSKTTSLTPAGNLYFAWQRKTGAFTFSANPICYV